MFLLLSFFISIVIYFKLFNFNIYTFSDWVFYFSQTLKDISSITVWSSLQGFGSVDTLLWNSPIRSLYGFISKFGYDFNIIDKLFVFWPMVMLLPLGSFLLVRKVIHSNIGAFVGSLVITYNTYFLSINTHGHEMLTLGFIISIFSLYIFMKLLEEKELFYSLIVALLLFVAGIYDMRSLYIISGVLGLYFIYYLFMINKLKLDKRLLLLPALTFILLGIVNLYWLLPTFFSSSLLSNEQFGRIISFSEFYKLQHALSFHFPFWTGGEPQWETFISIPWYFWLYPVFAILGLIVNRKNANIIFFGITALIGILLAKQVHIPFDGLYVWLYHYVPGFNAFREASKFYFLIALGYGVLIGGFIAYVWKKWQKGKLRIFGKYVLTTGIVILALWNTIPIVTGEIGPLFVPKEIPKDFTITKEFIFGQEEYFRTFWIHPSGRWILATNNHPTIDAESVIRNDWSKYLPYNFTPRGNEGKVVMNNMQAQRMEELLDLSSVKYVILFLNDQETEDYIYSSLGKSEDFFVDELEKVRYLEKIDIDTRQIFIYENKDFRPHIYASHSSNIPLTDFKAISPSEYKIQISNIRGSFILNFTDNFHPGWKLRVGKFNWIDVFLKPNYFLSDANHSKNQIGFNSFAIDPKEVCEAFNCKRNQDGSYDMGMTLFFKPQSHLYLGIIISGVTLVGAVGFLLYTTVKKRKNNGKA